MTLVDPLLRASRPNDPSEQEQQQHATTSTSTSVATTPAFVSDHVDPHRMDLPARSSIFRPGRRRRQSFLTEFTQSKGPPQLAILTLMFAIAFGSIIGVVPAVMTDRFARLNHGYDLDIPCSDYAASAAAVTASPDGSNSTNISVRPIECMLG
eukprot:CAMPEP_0119564974 /NCGR_PEP_ID=MMETSP1352-20130426/28563_1 /TAXON_ID=265584 /ORGANISM="Stauroneis constricta, Strain CCMP1120" /LENGTH=152 /DNA_ID=CAMNT_0007613795 /DNA_START=132 /DNA_END=586 /DNA_ORIENTATION=+